MKVPSNRDRGGLPRSILLRGLGILHVLPYEIRQKIFMIVLQDYLDELNDRRKQLSDGKRLSYEYNSEGCSRSCMRNSNFQFGNVFDLASYCTRPQDSGRAPLNLRFASPLIGLECDRIFLARSTSVFVCQNMMKKFLFQLRHFQLKQLRSLRLTMFESSDCEMKSRDGWMAACRFLPPRLSSVEIVMPERWESIFNLWKGYPDFDRFKESPTFENAADVLKVLCEEVLRAAPRARISLSGREGYGKGKNDVLDAMIRKVHPKRKFSGKQLDAWNA